MSDFTYDAYTEDGEGDTTTRININDIDDIYSLVEGDENENAGLPSLTYDASVYQAYADLHYGLPETVTELEELVDNADEAYVGEFNSREYFAREQFENTSSETDAWWVSYLDFDMMGRELLMSDFAECDCHYFQNI